MRELFHPTAEQLNLTTILNPLDDLVRLTTLKTFETEKEESCSCCSGGMTKSALSHHFEVLRECGLINARIQGKHRILSIHHDLKTRFPDFLTAILVNV